MAATTNGTATPPAALAAEHASLDASANKRKRDDDSCSGDAIAARKRQTQQDILELLQQHDTTPSFLMHEFDDVRPAKEPSPKKARLSGVTASNIASKLSTGAYQDLPALGRDASRVVENIERSVRSKGKADDSKGSGRLSVEDLKQIQRAKAFGQLIQEVVDKEAQYVASHLPPQVKKEASIMMNGHSAEPKGATGRGGTVLTLFGNGPTPKQLFSSMQNSAGHQQDHAIKTELPVEEMSLPNGLTATKVAPAPSDESSKAPTFEEAFPPAYSLAPLNPPVSSKTAKRHSTRDNTTITWEFKDPIPRGSRKGGYTVQSLSGGEWLGYGGVDGPESTRQKRKQRDRALSSGAESAKEPQNLISPEEQQALEEEALFRRAYSSFAPSYDNAKSIVPAEMKGMIWWHKVGAQRAQETFAVDPMLLDGQVIDDFNEEVEAEEDDFERTIEELDDFDEEMADVQQVTSKTDVDQVLLAVSGLLQTLASHQRIRHSTLTSSISSSRTPISPAPVLAARIGKPDEPAEDEVATYYSLRRELAYLILKLPPYAVAKLDGDQLSELGVKTIIPIKTKHVRGTMEEDQVARLGKHNAAATAAGIASLTRSNSSTTGQHYNTTSQRTPAIGQAANTRYGQTGQYASSRTPAAAPQYQRSTSNQAQYSTPTANSAASRSTYGTQQSQYTRPGAAQQSYGQTNGQYQQRPQGQYGAAGYSGTGMYTPQPQQYGGTPSAGTQARPAYGAQQQQQYQPRPTPASTPALTAFQQSAYAASAAASAQHRTGSPANVQPRPIYQAPPAQGAVQYANSNGPTSGRATPVHPQTPVQAFQRAPPQQVARAGSGTPQPGQVNGA